jgi:putative aldouronate transport system substrate-binding protein
MSTVEGGQEDQWDEVRAQNDAATASPLLGFIMDIEPVTDQRAACSAVWEKYRYDLLGGAVDPDVVIPQVISELNAVGFQEVLAEAQRQIDTF